MFLPEGFSACPLAALVETVHFQIPDHTRSNEIPLQLPSSDGFLAERTILLDGGPLLDTNITKSMPELARCLPAHGPDRVFEDLAADAADEMARDDLWMSEDAFDSIFDQSFVMTHAFPYSLLL